MEDPIHMKKNLKFLKFIEIAENEDDMEEAHLASNLSGKEEQDNENEESKFYLISV